MTNQRSAARDTQPSDENDHRLANLETRLADIHALVAETHKLAAATHRQVTTRPIGFPHRAKSPEDGWRFWLTSLLFPMLLAIVLIGGTAYIVKTFS